MSSNHHTPIANGANADDTVFNAPLAQLDQVITDMLDGSEPFTVLKGGAGAADASAALQNDSTTKGVLWFPRMTEAQRDAIGSPAEGLIVYNTDDDAPNGYNGSAWVDYFQRGNALQEIVALTSFDTSATISIPDIPQGYQDLLLRLRVRGKGSVSQVKIRVNADNSPNYQWSQYLGFSGAVVGTTNGNDTEIELTIPDVSPINSRYLDVDFWIRNYTKTGEVICGDFSGWTDGGAIWGSALFEEGSAINEIRILSPDANGHLGSYALYGLGTAE